MELRTQITPMTGEQLGDRIGGKWITMSNALIRAAHGLTLPEKRLIMMSISQLDSRPQKNLNEPPVSRIQATEYAEQFSLEAHTSYQQLATASKTLYDRSISFFEPAHLRKGKALEHSTKQMRWIGSAKYHEGEGWVELSWWHETVPHLMGLKRQFTTYQLQQASALRSIYSWKLLELLMRFKTTGWAEYTIEDFAASMGATEKQKANFSKIRTKIIEPAVRELTDKDAWLIQWVPIKTGRRVTSVRFDFRFDDQLRLF